MSISLYYSGRRDILLNDNEMKLLSNLIIKYNYLMTEYVKDKTELFTLVSHDLLENGEIFSGSIKLPNKLNMVMKYLNNWCDLLTEIKLSIQNVIIKVNVDDHEIIWDDKLNKFDPQK